MSLAWDSGPVETDRSPECPVQSASARGGQPWSRAQTSSWEFLSQPTDLEVSSGPMPLATVHYNVHWVLRLPSSLSLARSLSCIDTLSSTLSVILRPSLSLFCLLPCRFPATLIFLTIYSSLTFPLYLSLLSFFLASSPVLVYKKINIQKLTLCLTSKENKKHITVYGKDFLPLKQEPQQATWSVPSSAQMVGQQQDQGWGGIGHCFPSLAQQFSFVLEVNAECLHF